MVAPLLIAVGFVPELVIADTAVVPPSHRRRKIPKIVVIVRWGQHASHFHRQRPAPVWRITQPGNDLNLVRLGQIHNIVVLLPGRAKRLVPPIFKIPLSVNLNIFPDKLLPDEAKAGRMGQFQAQGPLFKLNFLLQEGVDAKRDDICVVGDYFGCQVGLGANGRIQPMHHPAQLRQHDILPRQLIQGTNRRPQCNHQQQATNR